MDYTDIYNRINNTNIRIDQLLEEMRSGKSPIKTESVDLSGILDELKKLQDRMNLL